MAGYAGSTPVFPTKNSKEIEMGLNEQIQYLEKRIGYLESELEELKRKVDYLESDNDRK